MKTSHPLFIFILSLLIFSCQNSKKQEELIFDEAAQFRLDSTLEAFVSQGKVAGISALIFEKGQERYFNALGYADKEAKRKMSRETLVQIYSMTKPITGAALMKAHEQGLFKLDDPLEKLPPRIR